MVPRRGSRTTTSSCPTTASGTPERNGFKTGFTQIAQHTLVATADRNGRQLIAVILGSVDSGYTWAASLLDAGFATPTNTKGTGIKLPPVAVSPYGTRVAQRDGFVQLAGTGKVATPSGETSAATTTSKPASVNALAVSRPSGNSSGDAETAAGQTNAGTTTAATTTKKHGGGLFTFSHFLLFVVIALFVAVLLRRRAVKRQRVRRIERQRARRKAMRSGSLAVVDGRYRTGTRLGPPVESQVRVQRGRGSHIDLTKDEPIRSTARGPARRRSK